MGNKWYGSNYEVIQAFVSSPLDERGGRNSQENIYFDGDGILYSYGEHFPLAVALKKHEDFFLVNGDSTTATTSRHRSDVFTCLRNYKGAESYAVVPFSALGQALGTGGSWHYAAQMTAVAARDELEVVCHEEDYWMPKKVWVTDKKTGERELKDVQEHFLGATLLKIDDEYFLSGIDGSGKGRGLYFLTKLPRVATSIDDAYEAIKPEGLNGDAYIRQGEWFLVPQEGMKKPSGIPLEKQVLLENRGRPEREWRHVATEGFKLNNTQFVRGTVRHPEHKMISLGNIWHRCYEAAGAGTHGAIVSWSVSGGFD